MLIWSASNVAWSCVTRRYPAEATGRSIVISPKERIRRQSAHESKLGKLDGAANLAGVFANKAMGLAEMTDEEWEFIMGIN
jgi:NAD(P)-dependent dehydrogenase (short-subunit alcohol dehydrogenase family)